MRLAWSAQAARATATGLVGCASLCAPAFDAGPLTCIPLVQVRHGVLELTLKNLRLQLQKRGAFARRHISAPVRHWKRAQPRHVRGRGAGVKCDGCVAKEHFVDMLMDSVHLPLLS